MSEQATLCDEGLVLPEREVAIDVMSCGIPKQLDPYLHTEEIVEKYKEWKKEKVKIVACDGTGKLIFWDGMKRGTDYYVNTVHEKIKRAMKELRKIYPNLDDWKFITLTVKEIGLESYEVVRKNWNRLLTILRQNYGKEFSYLRVFEFQRRGSVHIHILIAGIEWVDKYDLARWWKVGYVQVGRPKWWTGVVNYCSSYLEKGFDNEVANALFWWWKARQYSLSIKLVSCKTNSKPSCKYFGIGVCVVNYNVRSFSYSLKRFLKENGLNGVLWIYNKYGLVEALLMLRNQWRIIRSMGLMLNTNKCIERC